MPVDLRCAPETYVSKLSQSTLADIEGLDDSSCGFCRSPGSKSCTAMMDKVMSAHVVVCTSQPATEWHPKLKGTSHPEALVRAIDAATPSGKWIHVALANFAPSKVVADSDVLVFIPGQPPLVKRAAAVSDAAALATGAASQSAAGLEALPADLGFVMACAHTKRDARCGYCGPILADLAQQELGDRAVVGRISHVGGHIFAGNVLVYDKHGLDWFGYINPDFLPKILRREWSPEAVQRWRGRVGYLAKDLLPELDAAAGGVVENRTLGTSSKAKKICVLSTAGASVLGVAILIYRRLAY